MTYECEMFDADRRALLKQGFIFAPPIKELRSGTARGELGRVIFSVSAAMRFLCFLVAKNETRSLKKVEDYGASFPVVR